MDDEYIDDVNGVLSPEEQAHAEKEYDQLEVKLSVTSGTSERWIDAVEKLQLFSNAAEREKESNYSDIIKVIDSVPCVAKDFKQKVHHLKSLLQQGAGAGAVGQSGPPNKKGRHDTEVSILAPSTALSNSNCRGLSDNFENENLSATGDHQSPHDEELMREMNELRIDNAFQKLVSYVTFTSLAIRELHWKLAVLAGLSQAEPSTITKGQTDAARSLHSKARSLHNKEYEDNRNIYIVGSGTREYYKEFELTSFSDPPISDSDSIFRLDSAVEAVVATFQKTLEDTITNANFFSINSKSSDAEKAEASKHIQQVEQVLCGNPFSGKCHIPKLNSGEVHGAQPYFLAVFRALGITLGQLVLSNESLSDSPTKKEVFSNRPLSENKQRPKRVIDMSLGAANARFIYLFRDEAIEIPIEIKTFQTKSHKPEKLLHAALDQVLSHLAKQVGVGFNCMNVGADTRATGFLLTPTCVRVIQLRVVNMGTRNAELEMHSTKVLPLYSRSCYEHWLQCSGIKLESVSEHTDELYRNCTPDRISSGLRVITKVMLSSRQALFGPSPFQPSNQRDDVVEVELGPLLGFGGFASVYKCKKPENHVAKVSRYGSKYELHKEAETLKSLMAGSCDFIPRCEPVKTITAEISGVLVDFPVLILEPFAISVGSALARREITVTKIGDQLKRGMKYLHGRKFYHNDVTPKNVMYDPTSQKAFLVDFGCATGEGEQMLGFRGTEGYSHRQIFDFYPSETWTGCEEYDLAGLALTMATVSSNDRCPWSCPSKLRGLDATLLDSWANQRSQSAAIALQCAGFSEEWLVWARNSSHTRKTKKAAKSGKK